MATVTKTWKLFIGGAFPRTESGRTIKAVAGGTVHHLCKASRKDLRDAVEAARAAQPKWASSTAYLRGQILYRLAEMLEARRGEFIEAIRATSRVTPRKAKAEVEASIEHVVSFAGWTDKIAIVLGSQNPVAGPFTPSPASKRPAWSACSRLMSHRCSVHWRWRVRRWPRAMRSSWLRASGIRSQHSC